ncbi:MAG: transglutaminase domain-containing protein [Armatimonadetes bacterium]|nr:transglutaminase domain-containing protein [Armatimonadota bacterium]
MFHPNHAASDAGLRQAGRCPRLTRRLTIPVAAILWAFWVCYPNPAVFFQNLARYWRFPIDPTVVSALVLPHTRDPAVLEERILRQLPYEYDWHLYGVPWYVPTPAAAVRQRRGDCEARAMVLASVLAARGIPFHLRASFDHLWVQYPGKKPVAGERPAESWLAREGGRWGVQWPSLVQWRSLLAGQREALWDVMPWPRKLLLLGGWAALAGFCLWRRFRCHRDVVLETAECLPPRALADERRSDALPAGADGG